MPVGSPFATTAPMLIERGYSPLPILPGTEAPALSGSHNCCGIERRRLAASLLDILARLRWGLAWLAGSVV